MDFKGSNKGSLFLCPLPIRGGYSEVRQMEILKVKFVASEKKAYAPRAFQCFSILLMSQLPSEIERMLKKEIWNIYVLALSGFFQGVGKL